MFKSLNEEIEEYLLNEPEENPIDTLTLDIPLLMRLLEYSREDAKEDVDLHFVIENALKLQQEKDVLSMDDYEEIISKDELLV